MTQVKGQIVSGNLVYGPLNFFVCSRPSNYKIYFYSSSFSQHQCFYIIHGILIQYICICIRHRSNHFQNNQIPDLFLKRLLIMSVFIYLLTKISHFSIVLTLLLLFTLTAFKLFCTYQLLLYTKCYFASKC